MGNLFMISLVMLVFIIIAVLVFYVLVAYAHAKVDVDTGIFPTTQDSKGFYHIRGWIKNITHNETDTDISVEMTFTGGHFYKFALGLPTDLTKIVLPPQQTIYWDHTTNVPFAKLQYFNMQVRYNEIRFVITNVTAPVPTPAAKP